MPEIPSSIISPSAASTSTPDLAWMSVTIEINLDRADTFMIAITLALITVALLLFLRGRIRVELAREPILEPRY